MATPFLARRLARGFSLLELLVVFALMALLVSVVPPAMNRMRSGVDYRAAVRDVQTLLRNARHEAQISGRAQAFVVRPASREYGLQGRGMHVLPPDIRLQATTAGALDGLDGSADSKVILFFPAGGSSGGTIVVQREGSAGMSMRVDWLSGYVSREAL
ncbi:type II secretion system protein [Delftia acidovorans]|jgi:general secretion pathway protein H|uniref:type II secretion system protein n=1 Tax=Delftia acidovorans TaxID=80866 RepID=UPI0024319AEA|nr:type II secretion system protein [Delftia acidovorans]